MKKNKLLVIISFLLCFILYGCNNNEVNNNQVGIETTQELTEEITEQVTEETTEQVTEELTEETTEQVTEELTEETTEQVTEEPTEETTEQVTEQSTKADISELDDVVLNEMANKILNSMTLEEKVGQMLLVDVDSLNMSGSSEYDYKNMTSNMKKTLKKYNIGGVIFFARNISTRKQTKELIKDLQENSKIPLFISVDEEGGSVSRIASNEKMKTTSFPSMAEIGATNDTSKAFEVGDTIGKEINELGFNLDFAPVADINTNPDSPEIGDRSFGTDENLVASMVVEVVKGLQGQNVSATLKHFPGHGDADSDTHKGYADINQTINELRKVQFVPFKAGIDAGVDLIMVSHLAITEVTGNKTPASLSRLIVTDILRNELEYDNIIITDALNMKAITSYYKPEEAAVLAINAGVDILLMTTDIDKTYNKIIDEVLAGNISEKRINNSVRRILRIKLKRGILDLDYN